MSIRGNENIRKPSNVVAPGYRGRSLRILIGAWQIWFVSFMLANFNDLVFTSPSASLGRLFYFIGIAMAFRWLPEVINLGFSVRWGYQVRRAYAFLLLATLVLDFFLYGSVWGPPLGYMFIILGLYLHTHLGVANILSGLIGTPGCEMRSYAHLSTLLLGKDPTEAAICPGMWTPFDKWENQLKG